MKALYTMIKGWIFDKGAKVIAGAGAAAILFDVINRFTDTGMPASFCFEIGQGGALLLLAGLAVFLAFRSTPPTRNNDL